VGASLGKQGGTPPKQLNNRQLQVLGAACTSDFENPIHAYVRELFFFQKKSSYAQEGVWGNWA
jgi:hypothetical protein